jgi:tetraacyldisaccharide 4'-kinase
VVNVAVRRAALRAAVPASWIYGAVIAARNARYDRLGGLPAGRPTISVGNLTVGGTGKTPTVTWLASMLAAHRHRPIIAMRGYRSRRGRPSDEQAEYADRLPDVPVVASPRRLEALRAFLRRRPEIDCVLLDDGFQHRRISRDLDLVVFDASAGTLGDRLLPSGRLREPLSSLRRADAVLVTRAPAVDEQLALRIQEHHGRPPVAWAAHAWTGLVVYGDGLPQIRPVEWLRGRRVVTMLGVGNPLSVLRQVEGAGADVATNVPVRDHQRYTPRVLRTARRMGVAAEALLTTGKDWVKLRPLLRPEEWGIPVVVPRLELLVHEGAQRLEELVLSRLARPQAA